MRLIKIHQGCMRKNRSSTNTSCRMGSQSIWEIWSHHIWIHLDVRSLLNNCWSCASVRNDSRLEPSEACRCRSGTASWPITTTYWGNENVVYPNPPHPGLLPPDIHFSYFHTKRNSRPAPGKRNQTAATHPTSPSLIHQFRTNLDPLVVPMMPFNMSTLLFT